MTNMYNSYIHTLKFLKFKIKLIIAKDTRFIISFIYNILFITTRCYQHRKIPCPFRILTLRFIFYFIQSHHMMYVSHLVNDNCFIHILKDHIYFASWHWWSRLFHSHLSTEKKSISHPDNAYSHSFHPHIPPLEWYSQKSRILNES